MLSPQDYADTGVISNISTALSLVAAVVIALITVIRSRRNEKIQYTISLLQLKFSNHGIFRAHEFITHLVASSESFDPSTIPYPRRNDLVTDVERLLSYFELISIAYLRDDVDREIIREQIKAACTIPTTFVFHTLRGGVLIQKSRFYSII